MHCPILSVPKVKVGRWVAVPILELGEQRVKHLWYSLTSRLVVPPPRLLVLRSLKLLIFLLLLLLQVWLPQRQLPGLPLWLSRRHDDVGWSAHSWSIWVKVILRIIIIMLDFLASSLQTSQWCWPVCSPLENLGESYEENNHYVRFVSFFAPDVTMMLAGLLIAWASEWTVMKRIIIIMLDFLASSLQTSRWCWLVCSSLEHLNEQLWRE